MFNFQDRRAVVVENLDAMMTFTTVQDVATVVAAAVDLVGEWPEIGGIRGNRLPISKLLAIGERVRGEICLYAPRNISSSHEGKGALTVDRVKLDDLETGTLNISWSLTKRHASMSEEQAATMFKTVFIGTLLSSAKGAWDVSDEFNRLLPDHKFVQIDDFLTKVWGRKPSLLSSQCLY